MKPAEMIRVMLADDHRIFRDALRKVLEADCEIVAEAERGEDVIAVAVRSRPAVVILDLGMPGMGGLAAAHHLRKSVPAAKVLILSQYDDEEYVIEALTEAGVAGYLVKTDASAEELLGAVRAVAAGKRYLSPSIAPILIGRLRHPPKDGHNGPHLTRREREVLRLIGEGATAKDIANRLGISPKTAQVHRENLKQKLNLDSTAAMVRYAIKHKLVRID